MIFVASVELVRENASRERGHTASSSVCKGIDVNDLVNIGTTNHRTRVEKPSCRDALRSTCASAALGGLFYYNKLTVV